MPPPRSEQTNEQGTRSVLVTRVCACVCACVLTRDQMPDGEETHLRSDSVNDAVHTDATSFLKHTCVHVLLPEKSGCGWGVGLD